MNSLQIERLLDQEWIDPAAAGVQDAIGQALSGPTGERVADALHGVWLGHPLHPALVSLPLGAWTTAGVLDALAAAGHDEVAAGADAAVGIGLLGAVASAVTGLVDWQRVGKGKNRRLGAIHALVNIAATGLYAGSWLARRRGATGAGRALGWAGLAVVSAGGWLGGLLVFDRRLGVDHAEREGLPETWADALADEDLPEGAAEGVQVGDVRVLLSRREGRLHAIGEVCSHLGGPLAEGEVEDGTVRCPWHGSVFSLESGEVVHGPATMSQPCFDCRVRDGRIQVRHRSPD